MMPMSLAPLLVSVRPAASRSIRQGPVRAKRTESAPEVSRASSASQLTSAAHSWRAISKDGPRSTPPAKWVIRMAMTSGTGEVQVRVRAGPLSRSPRWRTG